MTTTTKRSQLRGRNWNGLFEGVADGAVSPAQAVWLIRMMQGSLRQLHSNEKETNRRLLGLAMIIVYGVPAADDDHSDFVNDGMFFPALIHLCLIDAAIAGIENDEARQAAAIDNDLAFRRVAESLVAYANTNPEHTELVRKVVEMRRTAGTYFHEECIYSRHEALRAPDPALLRGAAV